MASCQTYLSILIIGQFCETGASHQRQKTLTMAILQFYTTSPHRQKQKQWQWRVAWLASPSWLSGNFVNKLHLFKDNNNELGNDKGLCADNDYIEQFPKDLHLSTSFSQLQSEVFLPCFGLFGCRHISTPEKRAILVSFEYIQYVRKSYNSFLKFKPFSKTLLRFYYRP